jgi:DNA-binding MarR family transcriptional regulator
MMRLNYVKHAEELLNMMMKFKKIAHSNKFLEELSFNEIKLCGIIAKKEYESKTKAQVQMKDLSDQMKISRPALNALINKLEDKELVERVRLAGDRKSVYVQLSEKSYAIYHEEKDHMIRTFNSIVLKMGENDTQKLIELLTKFYDITEQELK